MTKRFWTAAVAVLVLLGCADAAWAWGPATHVGLAETVLSRLGLLPAGVAAILARNALAYLYGSIAADVVFAKRLSRVKQFCHHWSTGFRLLEVAEADRQKAFAYGYLSHLAADTVAHGKYVPRQIVVSGSTVNFGHLYWELRADAAQRPAVWQRLEGLLDVDHSDHHAVLACHIRDTFLSFNVNRALFERMNALTVQRGFRWTIGTWGRVSRWPLSAGMLNGYADESIDRILSVLSEGTRSPLLREDPNGTSALMQVSIQRRDSLRRRRRGAPYEHRLIEASRGWEPKQGPPPGRTRP